MLALPGTGYCGSSACARSLSSKFSIKWFATFKHLTKIASFCVMNLYRSLSLLYVSFLFGEWFFKFWLLVMFQAFFTLLSVLFIFSFLYTLFFSFYVIFMTCGWAVLKCCSRLVGFLSSNTLPTCTITVSVGGFLCLTNTFVQNTIVFEVLPHWAPCWASWQLHWWWTRRHLHTYCAQRFRLCW